MAQDCDEVIMIINYFVQKADHEPAAAATQANAQQKIKVNDRTATGGWW